MFARVNNQNPAPCKSALTGSSSIQMKPCGVQDFS